MKIYNVGPDELSDWDFEQLNQELEWIVVFYENYGYEGDGEAVGYFEGKLFITQLGHCSCYGPMDDGFDTDTRTVEEFKEAQDSIHGFIGNSAVELKVLELLG